MPSPHTTPASHLTGADHLIHCGLSEAFHNKDLKAGYTRSAWGNSFQPRTIPLTTLIDHILDGKSWTPGHFQGNSRKTGTFLSSQLLVLDFDDDFSVAQALEQPFIHQYACLVHPSASSGKQAANGRPIYKTRVVFRLSEPVREAEHWRILASGLIRHLGLQADPASVKPAQAYHGSTNRIEQPYICPDALLPLDVVETLAAPIRAEAQTRRASLELRQREARPLAAGDHDRAARYSRAAVEQIIQTYSTTPAGAGLRHMAFVTLTARLIGMQKGGWPGLENIEADICALGHQTQRDPHEIADAIQWAQQHAEPHPLNLPPRQRKGKGRGKTSPPERLTPPRIHAVHLPAFTANLTVNLPFITSLDHPLLADQTTLALKSPTGTGKTEFVAQLRQGLPDTSTFLAVTHRVSLVDSNARRFNTLHYRDLSGPDQGLISAAPQLAITVDSLHHQAGRVFDVLFIDEVVQVIRHIASAGTLKERTLPIYDTFKQLVRDAGLVILADAHLDNTVVDFFRALRSDVYTIENSYCPPRTPTSLLNSHWVIIEEAIQQVSMSDGPVLIPCATQRDARHIHQLLIQHFPDKHGQLITARNSETRETKHFVAHINEELPRLDWLIYTTSMGTGVDIQVQVAAVVGLFGLPISPSDALQMMGRARHALRRFAYAPQATATVEIDPRQQLADQLNAAAASSAVGLPAPDAATQGHARLKALLDAQETQQKATYLDYFAAYLQADGSSVQSEARPASAPLRAKLKAIQEAEEEQQKALVLDTTHVPTISSAFLNTLRSRGQVISDAIHAGHLRFKIETTSGLHINPDLYDRLKAAEQRRRLIRFTSLMDDENALRELDRSEAAERQPLHRRKHWTASVRLFKTIIQRAFGVNSLEALKKRLVDMPADDLASRVEFISRLHTAQLRELLHYRPAHDAAADNPIGLFRWICRYFGLKLMGKRARRDNVLTYVYSLDSTEFDAMLTMARARLIARREENGVPNSSIHSSHLTILEHLPAVQGFPTTVQPPPGLSERVLHATWQDITPQQAALVF